ncbi:MAG: hypothetical protein HKN50_11135 [Gammaproteobacteria bacterium]|nr:hypothetical protein [Gammaproteobacteria bacterium]
MTNGVSRRNLLLSTIIGIFGIAAYSNHRGIRYPLMSWEPEMPANSIRRNSNLFMLDQLLALPSKDATEVAMRALGPEPKLTISPSKTSSQLQLRLNNVSPRARLIRDGSIGSQVEEKTLGLTRQITISLEPGSEIELRWQLPQHEGLQFAAIGDTGAGSELEWCIKRAAELGATFLFHLGDFNYAEGDYARALHAFESAEIPCYVSVGNHDFHDRGLVYADFLTRIGPFNSAFSLGKTRFVNLDTAASFMPISGGARGRFVQQMVADTQIDQHTIIVTHRPLVDPDKDDDHDLGSKRERAWLLEKFEAMGADTMLCGHIHIFSRSQIGSLDQIVVGQGLGHQDLLVNDITESKIALGTIQSGGAVEWQFLPLMMPLTLHCHPRTEAVKATLRNGPHAQSVAAVDQACASGHKKSARAASKAL